MSNGQKGSLFFHNLCLIGIAHWVFCYCCCFVLLFKDFLNTGFLCSFDTIRFHLCILVIKYLAERNNLIEENLFSLTVFEGF